MLKNKVEFNNYKPIIFGHIKTLVGLVFIIAVIPIVKQGNPPLSYYWLSILISFLFLFLPSILLFLNYYWRNKDLSFEVTDDGKKMIVQKKEERKEYLQSDVSESVYHLGIFYRNIKDDASRWATNFSEFGYWEVAFENGDKYYFTNLIFDIHTRPIVAKTKYRFRMFPFIKKSFKSEPEDLSKDKPITPVSKMKQLYEEKTSEELHFIANNKNFTSKARQIAKMVLDKREGK